MSNPSGCIIKRYPDSGEYLARCKCGWQAPLARTSRKAADNDYKTHRAHSHQSKWDKKG